MFAILINCDRMKPKLKIRRHRVNYFLGVLLGLVWGAAAAILNAAIMKHFLKKQNTAMMMASNIIRLFVDILALGTCLLLRSSESVSFYTAIVGTAVSLSILTIIFTFKLAKPVTDIKPDTDTKSDTQI